MAYKETSITIPVGIVSGGTNTTVFTPYAVVLGPKADNLSLQDVGAVGSSGQVLTSNGAGIVPSWQSAGAPTFFTTSFTQDMTSTTTVNKAHGLGKVPKMAKFSCAVEAGVNISTGSYDGTNNASIYTYNNMGNSGSSNSYAIRLNKPGPTDGGANFLLGTITWDATNVIITWTKSGTSPTGTADILMEVF